jgi:hypothetical protein
MRRSESSTDRLSIRLSGELITHGFRACYDKRPDRLHFNVACEARAHGDRYILTGRGLVQGSEPLRRLLLQWSPQNVCQLVYLPMNALRLEDGSTEILQFRQVGFLERLRLKDSR